MKPPYNILFLCTGNSARSIIAESLANSIASERFQAFSAGSLPRGEVHPTALKVLSDARLSTHGLRSKDWREFAQPDAPEMDMVITVCDRAAGESCPVWPGQPVTAHWGVDDPVPHDGTPAEERAFINAMNVLRLRISLLNSLKLESLDRLMLQRELKAIGVRNA